MGKSKRSNKEFTREQKLIHENKALKRQVASLRKQLARVNLDGYNQVKDTIEEHCPDSGIEENSDLLDRLKEIWKCRECSEGYLEIIIYNRLNDIYYFRKCNNCRNRTKSQKYDPKIVKGVIKKSIDIK